MLPYKLQKKKSFELGSKLNDVGLTINNFLSFNVNEYIYIFKIQSERILCGLM